jgi:predicted TIM-barrel fold metal-dependent hydrolase
MVTARPFFDAHFHVIDPRFPLVVNQHFTPGPYPVSAYRHEAGQLLATAGFVPAGGAVVSGSFQAIDQTYLADALATLGETFVGVTQLDPETDDDEILRLAALGVRAVRINLVRRVHTDELAAQVGLALRARTLAGWHLELYVRSADLPQLMGELPDPDGVVIDHLGLTTAGLPTLLHMVSEGAHVKAAGFTRGDLVVASALQAIHQANPSALLAGTDLPGTRSPKSVTAADLMLLTRLFSGDDLDRVAYRNAIELYRPGSSVTTSSTATSGVAGSSSATST